MLNISRERERESNKIFVITKYFVHFFTTLFAAELSFVSLTHVSIALRILFWIIASTYKAQQSILFRNAKIDINFEMYKKIMHIIQNCKIYRRKFGHL